MHSLFDLFKEESVICESAWIGACLFGAISAFWATMAFFLEKPTYEYALSLIGLFGIIGAGGALISPFVGRITDKFGPFKPMRFGIVMMLAGYTILFEGKSGIELVIAGIILIDIGLQCTHIPNLSRDYALLPDARTRLNTKRPSFLTWLCILTFVGSGWAILSCIWSYTTAHKAVAIFSENARRRSDSVMRSDTAGVVIREKHNPFKGKMKASFSKIMNEDNIRKSAIGGFISSFLTLSGALLMWWLYRKGFYLYILGVVFGILAPFYVYGNDLLAIGISSFTNFFGLVFIALYALNLKSMTKGVAKKQVNI